MNTAQWLALISAAAPFFKWEITKDTSHPGMIRTVADTAVDARCPITAALYWVSEGEIDLHLMAWSAAKKAGLGDIDPVQEITKAADNPRSPLRDALIKAIGL